MTTKGQATTNAGAGHREFVWVGIDQEKQSRRPLCRMHGGCRWSLVRHGDGLGPLICGNGMGLWNARHSECLQHSWWTGLVRAVSDGPPARLVEQIDGGACPENKGL